MIEKTKMHFCPYCEDFSIEEHEVETEEHYCWWVCNRCKRGWPVQKEEQDEYIPDYP